MSALARTLCAVVIFLLCATTAHAQTVICPVTPDAGTSNQVCANTAFVHKAINAIPTPPGTTPGGTSGQLQYNNSGAFGGFTMSGDCTLTVPDIMCSTVNGSPVRPVLTGSPIFFVSTTGSDITGDGSSGNPWATGENAIFQLENDFDLGSTTPIIQFKDGTYNTASNSQLGFVGQVPVGGAGITLQGNLTTPSNVVFDGTAQGGGGQAFSLAANTVINIQGMKFQNFSGSVLNNQSTSGTLNITGPITIGTGNGVDIDWEAGGRIFCGEGTSPTTITITGAQQQLAYIAHGSYLDFNTCTIAFSSTPTFSFVLFNVDSFGFAFVHNTFTGSATGTQFIISGGGQLTYTNSSESALEPPSSMPGTASTGTNFGGFFNDIGRAFMLFSSLPGQANAHLGATASSGYTAKVEDGLAANCADGSCTTWGTHVTGGGGSLQLLVWWNGSNWTLIGK